MSTPENSVKHYKRLKAMYEAAAAKVAYDESLLWHRKSQNANRPSMLLGVDLVRSPDGGYLAVFHDLEVHGDTPEIAFDNFDRVWTQGEE